ncbi:MAG TPA: response regulator transcription factor [Micropepsaceae bacterium]|nr:response regulator transcription factor [Micropepsaceae bacterium]
MLVEDNAELSRRLSEGLRKAGFLVDAVRDGARAYELARTERFDAAVLDLGLPDMQGQDVLVRWRHDGLQMPVLILTARGSWAEKVDGLNAGADDYIAKPTHVQEIAARLKAAIRRAGAKSPPTLVHRDIAISPAAGRVTRLGKPIDLTAQEFRVLDYFMHRQDRVVSHADLIAHLYSGEREREANTIEVYVARLRRKLGRGAIKTVRGLGYRLG